MDRSMLAHFPAVLAVARRRSFAAAAAELGMVPSAISHAVRIVEDRLGLPLFTRTTRSVALTEAGAALVATIDQAFSTVEEAVDRVRATSGLVSGLLRLNVPRVALPIAITPILTVLAARHPSLTVEVTCDDALTDVVAAGFDAGVRLGEMIDQDMVAIRLTAPFKAIMVAAPTYLDSIKPLASVDDLRRCNCIGFRLQRSQGIYPWDLHDNERDVAVSVRGTALVSDPTCARELALAGVGIAYVFEPIVRADLREGRLRRVLPDAAVTEPGLFIYFPKRSAQMPKLRAFLDVAAESLRSQR